ncbi:MAG: hypothetical protein JJD97_13300 [Gemmatimonadaceae bacterium]|nr:hypothetical protein [Gemmatimonadaceae bacterium]
MRALVYNGPRDVSVGNVPDASIEEPYRHFDERDEGWTKVVLKPAG